MTQVTDSYEDIWSGGWDDMRLYGPMSRHMRRLMLHMTSDLSPARICDVGCGEGSLLAALHRAHPGAELAGIEISENAAALARRRFPRAAITVADIAATALVRTFDLVVSADVIEHIAEDARALANMAAMLAPGGRLVVATLQGRMRRFERDIGHQRNYRPGELAAKVEAAGLTVESTVEWGWPLYSPLYRDLLEALGNRGTMGRFGPGRKLICHILYAAFMLNSHSRGDYIFIRARKDA
jgi:2-polyprenyl-3-methyl-5-hydroxy-6-metoxy-1,4-benzoquinol methylase